MTGVAVDAVGRAAQLVPSTTDELRLPAWALGLLAFGTLCLCLFVVTRFNRDR